MPKLHGGSFGVTAGNRGVWLFRLLGPDDTVQAARSGLDSMLRSVR